MGKMAAPTDSAPLQTQENRQLGAVIPSHVTPPNINDAALYNPLVNIYNRAALLPPTIMEKLFLLLDEI